MICPSIEIFSWLSFLTPPTYQLVHCTACLGVASIVIALTNTSASFTAAVVAFTAIGHVLSPAKRQPTRLATRERVRSALAMHAVELAEEDISKQSRAEQVAIASGHLFEKFDEGK